MKVGRIILMTAIMLAWPTLALAGGNPCAPFFDLDADGVCDNVDNCPPGTNHPTGVANPAQTDTDGDGRGDSCDNCRTLDNGPNQFGPGQVAAAARSQCDNDSDGFGNVCDSDMNGDTFESPADNPIYLSILTMFIPPNPKIADTNCDGFMTPLDSPLYLASFTAGTPALLRGPSGWACAGPAGGCPKLP